MIDEPVPTDSDSIGEKMLRTKSATMTFVIDKTPESVEREEREKGEVGTISEEAFLATQDQIGKWVLSRLVRRQEATGKWGRNVRVLVTVEVDGEDEYPDPPPKTILPNAGHRHG